MLWRLFRRWSSGTPAPAQDTVHGGWRPFKQWQRTPLFPGSRRILLDYRLVSTACVTARAHGYWQFASAPRIDDDVVDVLDVLEMLDAI